MPGIPVVIVDSGGAPVTPVDSGAPVMTVAVSGAGMPITLTDNAVPFIIEGLTPPEPTDFEWQEFAMTVGAGMARVGYSNGDVIPPASGSISNEPTSQTTLLALYDDLNTGNIIAFFEGNYVAQMQGIQVSFGGFVLTSDDVRLEMGNTLVRFPGLPGFMQDGETYQVLFGFNLEEMQALASDDGAPLLADNGTYVETYDGRSTT